MTLKNFQLPSKEVSENINNLYIGDLKLFRKSHWQYEAINNTEHRLNEISELIDNCKEAAIDITLEETNSGVTIYCDGYNPEVINTDDDNIESILKHVICRLHLLLNPEETVNNIIGLTKRKNRFSYYRFAKKLIDECDTPCSPSRMRRAAILEGAPHKGDELEDQLRKACETIAGSKGYKRTQSKVSNGYEYQKVPKEPEQLGFL